MKILQLDNKELIKLMQSIGVDPYGIKIMVPKAIERVIKISSLSCVSANILKQEMLSFGGDVAVARGALTGKIRNTGCLLLGNLAQYRRLCEKLKNQPFGLDKIAADLTVLLNNYQKCEFLLDLGGYKFKVMPGRTYIMGIINLTPDSFSGDGFYSSPMFCLPAASLGFGERRVPRSKQAGIANRLSSIDRVIEFTQQMIKDGADIIDVGGESTRPNALGVSVKEELNRVIPVIKALANKIHVPISIDTCKPEVARRALDNGASIINDVTSLGAGPEMLGVAKKYKAGVVLMHMKGTPRTMQKSPKYVSLLEEVIGYLDNAVKRALAAGIKEDRIIIDPGIGFGKTLIHNLEILKNLGELKVLGRPILVGTSRKSFIGKILDADIQGRLPGTIASCVLAARNGASFLRVHDVKEVKQAMKLTDAATKA